MFWMCGLVLEEIGTVVEIVGRLFPRFASPEYGGTIHLDPPETLPLGHGHFLMVSIGVCLRLVECRLWLDCGH